MSRPAKFIAVLALLVPGIAFAQITPEQAQSTPVLDLAKRLLGESGHNMIEADRPRYPKILEPITFYSRAAVLGSQFGLCGATRATVHFDESGKVDGLLSEMRYGVAGNIHPEAKEMTDANYERICASVVSTRNYFPAPDPQSALEIAWYVEAISGRGPFASQSFEFTCTGACSQGRDNLSWLTLDGIDSAFSIPCTSHGHGRSACFQITIGNNHVGLFPKTFEIFGNYDGDTLVISKVHVVVGSTLAQLRPNNAFKPNSFRYANNMAGKACHVICSATRVGLT
jgi:hypothetical protein